MKKILVILDGASGLPVDIFGGRTSLEIAETPNLDFFAREGRMGFMYPINEKIIPGSDNALISIFGNDPKQCKRGFYEAIGLGIKLRRGDLALRVNFGTIDNIKNKIVLDRRAGRTLTTGEAKILAKALTENIKLPCKFEFKPSVQHRGVLILKGGFSDNISNIDPEWSSGKVNKFSFSNPFDDKDEIAKYTSNLVNEFVDKAFRILDNHPINQLRRKKGLMPANMLFVRGASVDIPKLKKYKSWMSINSMPLEIGISKASGMKVFSFDYPDLKDIDVYENLYDGLNKTIKFAIKKIKRKHKYFAGCYLQFKETDIPGHDNKPKEKVKMIEIIDKKFFGFLKELKDMELIVTGDHASPCETYAHTADHVPLLYYGTEKKDTVERFTEEECLSGHYGKVYGKDVIKKLKFE